MKQRTDSAPWYRHGWVWFVIAIPSSAVIAGMITLMLAIGNPDHLVVDQGQYENIRNELRAQDLVPRQQGESVEDETGGKP